MPKHNPEISTNIKTSKSFDYQLNGVSLTFSLNVDSIEELTAFKSLLQKALDDVAKIEESIF